MKPKNANRKKKNSKKIRRNVGRLGTRRREQEGNQGETTERAMEKLEYFLSITLNQQVEFDGNPAVIIDWRHAQKAKLRLAGGGERWVCGSQVFKAQLASKTTANYQVHED